MSAHTLRLDRKDSGRYRPRLEALKDRTLPAGFNALTVADLIADINQSNTTGGTNTITAVNESKTYGTTFTPDGTSQFTSNGLVNSDSVSSVTLTSSGYAATTTVAGSPYAVTPNAALGSGLGNYAISYVNGQLIVKPVTLSATAVNFSATARASFSGTVATFTNADPFGSATSYTALITWGDGSTSAGVISGTGSTLTVTGSHTYADPVNEGVSVQISHNLGYTATATVSDTATVTSLGLSVQKGQTAKIDFWGKAKGQALITSFNGGSTATALSAWLAATFPNLYGSNAGGNNLSGKTNAQVAAYFQALDNLPGPRPQAQVLATALNVSATTASLGGSAGVAYGFTVSATGLGARSFNVGDHGAAVGVPNKTTLNVYELLLAVNKKAVNGVLDNGNAALQKETTDLFNALNDAGNMG